MPSPPRSYLLAWRLHGQRVTVVGGGSIGTAKVETLQGTGAEVYVYDPMPSRRMLDLAKQNRVTLKQRKIRPTDLVRSALVIAATGDSRTNRRVRQWAKPFGAVVNAVDDRDNCDVTVPAVVHRGPATIAITTGGTTPAGARFLREELTEVVSATIPDDFAQLFEHAQLARSNLRTSGRYRYDYAAWRQLFFEPGLSAVRAGRSAALAEVRRRFEAEFASPHGPIRTGTVTLVGAGPGGVDLITVRGAKALGAADVVVYDRLADPDLLDFAPPAAERIPVGKGKGFGLTQAEINGLLIERASAGNHVVRLKGGDPFVFGRGAEEVEALNAAGIDTAVVPGVSSAFAGPALAGVSVTDRRKASSVAVLTGHRANEADSDVASLAPSSSTLVILMAASTADSVAQVLLSNGRPSTEPAAFVHAAGTERQQTHYCTLAEVASLGCPFPAPTVMVVGVAAAPVSSSVVNGACRVESPEHRLVATRTC